MCRELLDQLRNCNERIDHELTDKEKLDVLWEACILNRLALTEFVRAALEEEDITDTRRAALDQFLTNTMVEDHPFFRSHDGKPADLKP